MEFQTLLKDIVPPCNLKDETNTLLKRKIAGDELNLEPRIDIINEFLNSEIEHLEDFIKQIKIEITDPTLLLDQLFRESLEEIWS